MSKNAKLLLEVKTLKNQNKQESAKQRWTQIFLALGNEEREARVVVNNLKISSLVEPDATQISPRLDERRFFLEHEIGKLETQVQELSEEADLLFRSATEDGASDGDLTEAEDVFYEEVNSLEGSTAVLSPYLEKLEQAEARLREALNEISHREAALDKVSSEQGDHLRTILYVFEGTPEIKKVLNDFQPGMTLKQAKDVLYILDTCKFLKSRKITLFREWRSARLKLLEDAKEAVEPLASREREAAEVAQRADERRLRQEYRTQLDQFTYERAKAKVVQESAERLNREFEASRKRVEEQKRKIESKTIAEKYKIHKRREEDARRRQSEQADFAAFEQRRRLHEIWRERVAYREQLTAARQQELQDQRQTQEVEKQEREERLRRALEKFRVEGTADPQRILQHTTSSRAVAEPRLEIFKRHGFSEIDLNRDPRHRLSVALSEAGLFKTPAARSALLSMIKRN